MSRKIIEPFRWMGFTSINGVLRFVLLFLILIPLLIMGVFTLHEYYNAKARTIGHLNQMAIMQRDIVDSWLENHLQDVQILAGQESVLSMDEEDLRHAFEIFLETHKEFNTIKLFNESYYPLPLPQNELSIYVRDQENSLLFSVPVYNQQGELGGSLVASMPLETIDSLLQQFKYEESGAAFLIRKDGRLINELNKDLQGKKVPQNSTEINSPYLNLIATRSGADSERYSSLILQGYPDYRGVNVFGVHQELKQLPWVLIAEVDQKEVLAPYYRRMLFLAGVYLVLILLAIPVVYVMLRRIRLPIQGLLHAARKIEQGEYDTVIKQELISPSPRELQVLAHAFNHMGSKIKEDIELLNSMNTQLLHISLHDSLTGLYNRTYFEEEMHRLSSGRFNPVGIIVCDVNSLKVINDALGHQFGDELIKKAGRILKESLRESDVVARIGGDEFVIILPSTPESSVQEVCFRLEKAVEESNMETPHLPLYMAMGMAVCTEVGMGELEKTFRLADDQMYEDKMEKNKTIREKIIKQLLAYQEGVEVSGLRQNYTSRVEQMARNLGI